MEQIYKLHDSVHLVHVAATNMLYQVVIEHEWQRITVKKQRKRWKETYMW